MASIDDYLGISGNSGTPRQINPQPEEFSNRPARRSSTGDNIAESVLRVLAYLVLIFGSLLSIGFGISIGSIPYSPFGSGSAALGILAAIIGIIFSVVIWASLMVTVNISTNIRAIKHEMFRRN